MKTFRNFLLSLLLLPILGTFVSAQYTYQIVLRNATAPDNGTSANIIGSGAAFHNLTWNVSGTVSTCSVRVDGSADGVTWGTGDVIGATTCTSNGSTLSSSHIVNYVRINLVTFTGTLPVFTANVSGYITQPSGGGTVTSVTCGTGLSGGTITSTGTCSTSSSNIVGLFTGCSGTQYLGADGACHTPGGGALVQVETHTASNSASLNFTTCISSTYHIYKIEINNLTPVSDSLVYLRMSTDGGSTYVAGTSYDAGGFYYGTGTSSFTGNVNTGNTSQINMWINGSNLILHTGAPGYSANMELYSPGDASNFKYVIGQAQADNSADSKRYGFQFGGTFLSTTAVNAFQILMSTGNISSGTVTCYGVTP